MKNCDYYFVENVSGTKNIPLDSRHPQSEVMKKTQTCSEQKNVKGPFLPDILLMHQSKLIVRASKLFLIC